MPISVTIWGCNQCGQESTLRCGSPRVHMLLKPVKREVKVTSVWQITEKDRSLARALLSVTK